MASEGQNNNKILEYTHQMGYNISKSTLTRRLSEWSVLRRIWRSSKELKEMKYRLVVLFYRHRRTDEDILNILRHEGFQIAGTYTIRRTRMLMGIRRRILASSQQERYEDMLRIMAYHLN